MCVRVPVCVRPIGDRVERVGVSNLGVCVYVCNCVVRVHNCCACAYVFPVCLIVVGD